MLARLGAKRKVTGVNAYCPAFRFVDARRPRSWTQQVSTRAACQIPDTQLGLKRFSGVKLFGGHRDAMGPPRNCEALIS